MSRTVRYLNRFEYHLEDFDCEFCLHYDSEKKRGCTLARCCCEEEKREALAHNRIKRPRGWFRVTHWDNGEAVEQWDG